MLPADVAVVAAANPPEMSAGGWDLSPPLANRFCHIDWPTDSDRFLEALTSGWPPPLTIDSDRPPVLDSQGASAIKAKAAIGGYLRSRPMVLYQLPDEIASTGRAWPSPRGWDMAAVLWTMAEQVAADLARVMTLLSGCVGPGAARELLAWQKEADLPDPEAVLADPGSCSLPERGDRQFALLNAVAAAVLQRAGLISPPR